MKRCSICKILKDTSEFYPRNVARGGFESRCKACSLVYARERRAKSSDPDKRRRRLLAAAKSLLGSRCVKCGQTDALDFDHIDPSTKIFDITRGATNRSEKAFWLEVAKCQLLCRPCHIEKSNKDHHLRKLSEQDVRRIRELVSQGLTERDIADKYGVNHTTIGAITRGRTWKHVK